MNERAKATSLARVEPRPVAAKILGLYGFATAALMVIIHLAG